ncbi:MAG TPA: SpoVR family protein [Candidatus Kapabacteria bacterium]|nr:SpoVR family protein [Candidatus Kapabacteria bacterium]
MKLLEQNVKTIMEECKVRARGAGLKFDDESLEYIVTNQDMIELSPKGMISTMYNYWVNDVEILKGKGQYKLYPHNPFETVINSRPAISYYNDNNPDWMNIMIFYHVLGHIDFFQNNILFEHTWKDDFVGQALADKRLIEKFRSNYGRWVDYIIEFSRGIDNLVGYFTKLAKMNLPKNMNPTPKLDYYFSEFLEKEINAPITEFYKEIDRFNKLLESNSLIAEQIFFSDIKKIYPEFESKFERFTAIYSEQYIDIIEFIRDNSPFLKKDGNDWMRAVMNIVRDTAMYFAPQIRTKTINEGWASYWHDTMFRSDDRISGYESEYAVLNSMVTSLSRVGYNPYAIGLRLLQYVEYLGDTGKITWDFQKIHNAELRESYDSKKKEGKQYLFDVRTNFSDLMLINTFIDQDFVDFHNLFVVGQRIDPQRGKMQYYVKSRKADDYKKMIINNMYHPPYIKVDLSKTNDSLLYLKHHFEGKQLYKQYIPETLMGIEFLWQGNNSNALIQLETTEIIPKRDNNGEILSLEYRPVLYTMKDRKLSKRNL